jgi:hypothetical protein
MVNDESTIWRNPDEWQSPLRVPFLFALNYKMVLLASRPRGQCKQYNDDSGLCETGNGSSHRNGKPVIASITELQDAPLSDRLPMDDRQQSFLNQTIFCDAEITCRQMLQLHVRCTSSERPKDCTDARLMST